MTVQQGRDPRDAARIGASATWLTILFGAPVLFGVAALSDPLLRLMYGMKYLPAIPVLTTLALFGLTLAASAPTQFLLVAADRQVFYLTWLIVSGLVDVAGNLVLVPRFGAIGAAYAKGIAQTVGAAGFLIYLVRHFKVSLPWWRIFRLVVVCAIMRHTLPTHRAPRHWTYRVLTSSTPWHVERTRGICTFCHPERAERVEGSALLALCAT